MEPDRNRQDAENATKQPLRCCAVDAVNCRGTARKSGPLLKLIMIVGLLGVPLTTSTASSAGATTSTTLPGPAPNQSQINATQSQVGQIEATLAQEEQQTSILDDKYNTAEQNLQNAQNQLQALAASLVQAKNQVTVDKKLVASDAVAAYVYGTPATGFTSYFSS